MDSVITMEDSGLARVAGPVTRDSVIGLREQGRAILFANPGAVCQVDLSAVTEFDSTILSLMLCWLRESQASSVSLQFKAVPDLAKRMAAAYGVEFIYRG